MRPLLVLTVALPLGCTNISDSGGTFSAMPGRVMAIPDSVVSDNNLAMSENEVRAALLGKRVSGSDPLSPRAVEFFCSNGQHISDNRLRHAGKFNFVDGAVCTYQTGDEERLCRKVWKDVSGQLFLARELTRDSTYQRDAIVVSNTDCE